MKKAFKQAREYDSLEENVCVDILTDMLEKEADYRNKDADVIENLHGGLLGLLESNSEKKDESSDDESSIILSKEFDLDKDDETVYDVDVISGAADKDTGAKEASTTEEEDDDLPSNVLLLML